VRLEQRALLAAIGAARMPLTAPELITAPRLQLHRLVRPDLDGLFAVNGDPLVTQYLPYKAWTSPADGEAWYQRMENLQRDGTAIQWVIARNDSLLAIGTCLLFRYEQSSECAELGYVLGRAYWGQGWMSEALNAAIDWIFTSTPLRRLEAFVDGRNEASCTLLRRIGFVPEGILRERWQVGTALADANIFGLLRRDWRRA
jgi:[ribosomal protein S5]-alanine N-acetyltransferase